MKHILRVSFFLSLIGLAVSAFLAHEYAKPGPIICVGEGFNCETVRQSVYSSLLGIQLPYYGILYYLFVAVTTILAIHHQLKKRIIHHIHVAAASIGLVFSLYLLFIEAFLIHAFCFWCVISSTVTILIFVISLPLLKVKHHEHIR